MWCLDKHGEGTQIRWQVSGENPKHNYLSGDITNVNETIKLSHDTVTRSDSDK